VVSMQTLREGVENRWKVVEEMYRVLEHLEGHLDRITAAIQGTTFQERAKTPAPTMEIESDVSMEDSLGDSCSLALQSSLGAHSVVDVEPGRLENIPYHSTGAEEIFGSAVCPPAVASSEESASKGPSGVKSRLMMPGRGSKICLSGALALALGPGAGRLSRYRTRQRRTCPFLSISMGCSIGRSTGA
jgi:hypothetical protein